MIRWCADCGADFDARGTWQRFCWSCWRRQEDRKLERGAYDRGYEHGYRDGSAVRARAHFRPLDAGLLRDLIQLAHPDRHPVERAPIANRATAALLELLERERRAA